MDRTEAIDILRVIAPPRTSKKAFYDFMEARDMAIKALEQPEIIHCKECLCKEICSWKREGAKFCNFGVRGEADGHTD